MRIGDNCYICGELVEVSCDKCIEGDLVDLRQKFGELRLRLQALEQNTAPARPAEQKPREYWLIAGKIFADKAGADAQRRQLYEPQPAPVHVREVL